MGTTYDEAGKATSHPVPSPTVEYPFVLQGNAPTLEVAELASRLATALADVPAIVRAGAEDHVAAGNVGHAAEAEEAAALLRVAQDALDEAHDALRSAWPAAEPTDGGPF